MTEFFAQPDDTGELQASELNTSLGESLGARAGDAAFSGLRTLTRNKEYSEAESAQEGLTSQIQRLQNGEDLGDVIANPQPSKLIPQSDAQDRVKQAGVTGIKLPAGDIREPVLDLMISHAHERQQYDAAVSRGPSGLLPGALGFATEVGAGMIDPINVAAFSIPIMGEARFGMMLANAGESLASRAAVRAGIGAAQGAVGSTLLEPGQWWLHTHDGQDYTYADALRGVIMGAAMGGAFGAVHGGINDVRARAAGRPLAGSVDDLAQRALAGDEQAAGILQATPEGRRALAGEQPVTPTEATPAPVQAAPATEAAPPGLTPAMETRITVNGETQTVRSATMIPEPEAVFTDLPAQVREDTVRASMADAINGNLGRGGELLKEAAKDDPRIAESLAAGRESTIVSAAEFSEPARAVFADMSTQLKAAGMGEEEAAANAAVVAARYEARAARLEGAGGTAEDLYRAEGIRVQRGGIDDELGRSFAQSGRTNAGQTEAFRTWFGDSKAVDADGNPQVFYHGTTNADAIAASGFKKGWVHLTDSVDVADSYQAWRRGNSADTLPLYVKTVNPAYFDAANQKYTDLGNKIFRATWEAERGGHDAMIVKNVRDNYDSSVPTKPHTTVVVFDPTQIKSVNNRGTFDPRDPRILYQPATVPTFFSAVSKAINAARQEKASPEQWLATLRNTPGVKQEELQWLGLPDWLKEQAGTVTRKDIQDYVRANNIEVREVEKGGPTPEASAAFEKADHEFREYSQYLGDKYDLNPLQNLAMYRTIKRMTADEVHKYEYLQNQFIRARDHGEKGDTKFQSYTLPGGENYREMLLTLPEKKGLTSEDLMHEGQQVLGPEDFPNETISASPFRSSHFEEPNILSHIRFNDRTIDGKKTLFIEEIQSDWHQAGKRKGYQNEKADTKGWTVRDMGDDDLSGEWRGVEVLDAEGRHRGYSRDQIHEDDEIIANVAAGYNTGAVPDAPFKTTWPELAFKRMIRYAAENGYEKIAWTPGEVQAERYDLSKQISRINYQRVGNDRYDVEAFDHGEKRVMSESDIPAARVEELVGKDLAKKMVDTVGVNANDGPYRLWHNLEGLDLKVGGEGMKGFYDKILPATVNKLVKKYGAKVEDAKVQTEPDTVEIVSRGRGALGLGRETFGARDPITGDVQGSFPTREAAEASLDGIRGETRQSVHAIDLTEPLRKAATEEGFPLFQREPGGEMRGRITLADNRAIIDLFRSADKSTFMHETGHLWLDEMARDSVRQNAPEGTRKDMDTVLHWLGAERPDAITTEQHEKFARGFETYLASGEAPTSGLRAVFERFKDWLSAIYKGLVGAGEEMPPEIRRVMDRMLATPEQLGEKAQSAGADILPGPRAARGPRARDPATFSLLEFLASRGGIRSSDPLISDLRSSIGRSNRFVPGFGQLIRAPRELSTAARMGGGRAPMTLDQAREAAVEAGYLHDEGAHTGGESTTTINTLLDAMDREMRGERVYRAGHEPARKSDFDPDEEMHRLHSAIDDAVRDVGLDPVALPEPLRARILEIMTKEGERDPEIAYERAVMEETHYGEEANRNERIQDHIPGWDEVHDVGRPAQASGGPAAQFTGPAGADAGAAPRRAGGDDRQAGGQRAAGAGNGAAAPAGRPGADWRALAAAAKSDDADLIASSRAAAREKPPESTDTPEKAVSAAELKAKEAEQLLADILPRLTEEERIMMTDMLNAADRDRSEREQIVREGAACLAAGLVGAV